MKTKQSKRKPANKLLLPNASHKHISLAGIDRGSSHTSSPYPWVIFKIKPKSAFSKFPSLTLQERTLCWISGSSLQDSDQCSANGSQGNLENITSSLCAPFPPLFSLKVRNVPYPVYPALRSSLTEAENKL